MAHEYTPAIVAAKVIAGNVVIAFNDGKEILFKAEVLHRLFLLGREVTNFSMPENDLPIGGA